MGARARLPRAVQGLLSHAHSRVRCFKRVCRSPHSLGIVLELPETLIALAAGEPSDATTTRAAPGAALVIMVDGDICTEWFRTEVAAPRLLNEHVVPLFKRDTEDVLDVMLAPVLALIFVLSFTNSRVGEATLLLILPLTRPILSLRNNPLLIGVSIVRSLMPLAGAPRSASLTRLFELLNMLTPSAMGCTLTVVGVRLGTFLMLSTSAPNRTGLTPIFAGHSVIIPSNR
jgi:hypothetical protein